MSYDCELRFILLKLFIQVYLANNKFNVVLFSLSNVYLTTRNTIEVNRSNVKFGFTSNSDVALQMIEVTSLYAFQ